jgi:hypothetical protein
MSEHWIEVLEAVTGSGHGRTTSRPKISFRSPDLPISL